MKFYKNYKCIYLKIIMNPKQTKKMKKTIPWYVIIKCEKVRKIRTEQGRGNQGNKFEMILEDA